jgi:Cof subfamily protein (haloacid dehalogenase superfamily)
VKYRLIALDLDGTALDSAGQIRPRTHAAVNAALARGFVIILVTGRHYSVTRPFHTELGLTTPAICCNGTCLYDFAANRVIDGHPIAPEAAARLVDACRRHGVQMVFYMDDAIAYETMTPHLQRLDVWIARLPEHQRPVMRKGDLKRLVASASTVWKAVVSHPDATRLSTWYAEAATWPDFNVEYSWRDRIDVVPSGISKGARLLSFAAERAIAPDEIVAFGDNHNDITMLAAVGLGIAMGNADDTVKARAKRSIGSNDSDAIAEALDALPV